MLERLADLQTKLAAVLRASGELLVGLGSSGEGGGGGGGGGRAACEMREDPAAAAGCVTRGDPAFYQPSSSIS